jgi:hypothetical protein
MKTLLKGYFISSSDMYMLDDMVKNIPVHMDNEDAMEEIIELLESRTPIIVQLGEQEDG